MPLAMWGSRMNLIGSAAPSTGISSVTARTASEETDLTKDVGDMGTPFPSGEGVESLDSGIYGRVSVCHKRGGGMRISNIQY